MSTAKDGARRATADEALELWRSYKQTGDVRLRDRLVLTFAPMVRYIVKRRVQYISGSHEIEDFISCGLEALIRSIDRFDPSKGASLEKFAWIRIDGAVLDELRRIDWAPRSVRQWERQIRKTADEHRIAHGRAATDGELCDGLGIERAQLATHRADIARARLESLNAFVSDDGEIVTELIDTLPADDRDLDPEHAAVQRDAKERLRAAVESLSPRDQQVAVLAYVHQLTLAEIGEVIGVTQSRVCQIRGEISKKLHNYLRDDEQLFAAVL